MLSLLGNSKLDQVVSAVALALHAREDVIIIDFGDLNTTKEFLHVFEIHPEETIICIG